MCRMVNRDLFAFFYMCEERNEDIDEVGERSNRRVLGVRMEIRVRRRYRESMFVTLA